MDKQGAEQANKRQKTSIPPNECKDYETFNQYYGAPLGYVIDNTTNKERTLTECTNWKLGTAIKSIIRNLIQSILPDWYNTYQALHDTPTSEADIEPLVFDALKPIVALTSIQLKSNFNKDKSYTTVEAAAINCIAVSGTPSMIEKERGKEDEKDEEEVDAGSINIKANLEDPDELVRIYFAMEHHLKRISDNVGGRGGRVEFVLLEGGNKIRAVVEAKTYNPSQGIYQCAAYLVLAAEEQKKKSTLIGGEKGPETPIWGICTDYNFWIFLKLQGKRIQISPKFSLFNIDREILSTKALDIFAFLLEIVGIPPDFNFAANRVQSLAACDQFCTKMMEDI